MGKPKQIVQDASGQGSTRNVEAVRPQDFAIQSGGPDAQHQSLTLMGFRSMDRVVP
jgi:hypothetical protein